MAENQVLTYQEVAAYQAENGVETYGVGSGGYTTGGIYVSWDTENGFTGGGWEKAIDNPSSPVFNKTEDQIREEIRNQGNLNSFFETWVTTVNYKDRYEWILDNVSDNCRYEIL